jgi:malonyl-CoA O-methyltransferase
MINTQTQKIKACFDKAYSTYDQHSQVQVFAGEKLIKAMFCKISKKLSSEKIHHIIDLGCGTGTTTEKLVKQLRGQEFYAMDISEKLLLSAREKLKNYTIKIIQKNFENFYFKEILFDLAFSNMALQWSADIQKTFSALYHHINTGGILAFSVPLADTFAELKKYNKNKFYTSDEIVNFLYDAGFKNSYYFLEKIQIDFDTLLNALKYIKLIGANYVRNYTKFKFSRQGLHQKFSLTYYIGFFIAEK